MVRYTTVRPARRAVCSRRAIGSTTPRMPPIGMPAAANMPPAEPKSCCMSTTITAVERGASSNASGRASITTRPLASAMRGGSQTASGGVHPSIGTRPPGLHGLHRELRVEAGDRRQLGELVHVEPLVRDRVGDRHPQQVVGHAEHAPALDHRLEAQHPLLEGLHGRSILDAELDVHHSSNPRPTAAGSMSAWWPPRMAPDRSSARTRRRHGEGERWTRSASSTLLRRPSSCRWRKIARSMASIGTSSPQRL